MGTEIGGAKATPGGLSVESEERNEGGYGARNMNDAQICLKWRRLEVRGWGCLPCLVVPDNGLGQLPRAQAIADPLWIDQHYRKTTMVIIMMMILMENYSQE